jgi:putative inorganic carbon (hco3(-)) transporter
MNLRDLLIIAIVFTAAVMALRRPWIGVMSWTWLSLMNPHRYAWGWAYDAPLAAIAAGTTLLGLLATKDRESPFKGSPPVLLAVFMVWMTLSWLVGLDPAGDYVQWDKVMKVTFMVLVSLCLLRTKQHIFALAWVCAASLALLGIKGGVFTILTGGSERVWGPPGTFIADNNEFSLALVMTIPLLRFLQMQVAQRWLFHALTLAMLLCAAAALGSQSRGGFLAIAAMSVFLWWRGGRSLLGLLVITITALLMVTAMPDTWSNRMATISDYSEDSSALGRISAWWNAWNLAFHYPAGVGFNAARPELFARFSPTPEMVHAAHSIYFQVLGNHGFIGLLLFLLIWWTTWRTANKVRRATRNIPEARWCAQLAAMCQVTLVGYFTGGAFLSLSYFDLPYNVMVLIVLTHVWVRKRGWETEPVYTPGWRTLPGLANASARQAAPAAASRRA